MKEEAEVEDEVVVVGEEVDVEEVIIAAEAEVVTKWAVAGHRTGASNSSFCDHLGCHIPDHETVDIFGIRTKTKHFPYV